MPKAIFKRAFHYTSRKKNAGWSAYPSKKPQLFPAEFIEAAIRADCAIAMSGTKPSENDER